MFFTYACPLLMQNPLYMQAWEVSYHLAFLRQAVWLVILKHVCYKILLCKFWWPMFLDEYRNICQIPNILIFWQLIFYSIREGTYNHTILGAHQNQYHQSKGANNKYKAIEFKGNLKEKKTQHGIFTFKIWIANLKIRQLEILAVFKYLV